MKKSVNRVALALWILAVVVFASEVILEPYLHYLGRLAAPEADTASGRYFWMISLFASVRSGVVSAALLVAVGTLIELLDQVRWMLLHGRGE